MTNNTRDWRYIRNASATFTATTIKYYKNTTDQYVTETFTPSSS